MKIKAIVAIDENWGIAKSGKIPWNIPADLAFFKEKTIGNGNNAVVMGYNTKKTIPNFPLAQRKNIVISGKGRGDLTRLEQIKTLVGFDTVWIIGGEKIYQTMLEQKLASTIYISKIPSNYHCDQFFNFHLLEKSYHLTKTLSHTKEFQIQVWKHNY